MIAAVGFVVLLALALALLWRVYLHHTRTNPYDSEAGAIVKIANSIA